MPKRAADTPFRRGLEVSIMADEAGGEVVRIVDDDPSLRDALADLFQSVGRATRTFATVRDFLESDDHQEPGCLILDIRMPGINGLDFQAQLQSLGITLPVIIVTGHGDIPMTVRAMKAGAVDFFTKPFREQELIDAVDVALTADHTRRVRIAESQAIRARYGQLTSRERQVMALVTAGRRNKQVAGELDLSEVTVKIHRGSAMRKMQAPTLAEFVRMAQMLELAD